MTSPALQVRNVRAGYDGRDILQDVSFDLYAGEVLGVAGPNGGGKSTLLRAATGLLPLRTGSVQISGRDLAQIGFRERARLCAVQPQVEAPLFDYSVEQFVMLGRHPHRSAIALATATDHAAVEKALARTDLSALAARSIRSLSTGEWQRALIARAVAQDAPVVLLDEPGAHLDPGHRHEMHLLLKAMAREEKRAVLCISHDLNLAAEFCGRLMLVAGGTVRGLGAPAEVLRDDLLQEVFRCPSLRVGTNPFSGRPNTFFAP